MDGGARADLADRYLDLLARTLIRDLGDPELADRQPPGSRGVRRLVLAAMRRTARRLDHRLVRPMTPAEQAQTVERRRRGQGVPAAGETMIGLPRLHNIRTLVRAVLDDGIEGDLIECGVWRGGASIYMRACLEAMGDHSRSVWLADSFAGLPPPDAQTYPADEGLNLHMVPALAVGLDEVRRNVERYGFDDERMRFVEGFFRDTLPTVAAETFALLRLDGDLYQSTWETLTHLYPRLSPGGFVIVDDYGLIPACRAATDEFRGSHSISAPLTDVDGNGVWWRKPRDDGR